MKISTILIVLTTLLFYSCSSNNTATDISGTYVTHFKNEFNITDDTLIVSTYSLQDKIYNIESRTGFHKIRNGSVQPKQYQIENTKAKWDVDKKVLEETELGHQIQFIAQKSILLIGNTEYHKIN
ncbi:hypothetical protein [Mucilaginibacter sp.]|uniref:hypothetical protein n=1 Tax=Mucilaginibacter sp. TaxID=1882438 RepID=UPI002609E690|nr:hypothetical protein [Mucilaginibacter sp.]MDB5032667.1 hypothetical protein [Mucilaginibacter sp.]